MFNLVDMNYEDYDYNMTTDEDYSMAIENEYLLSAEDACYNDSAFYYCNLTDIYCGFCGKLKM